jgi:alanine dehydrogenase
MRIGIPRETKEGERRVGLEPSGVEALVGDGHDVLVESGAGRGIGQGDGAYRETGAMIATAAQAWKAELIVKVKEIQAADLPHVKGQAIFGFQQLPGEPERTRELAARGVTAIAFEMVRDSAGGFPLLAPMSVIAGRMALEVATRHLGRAPARVLVLGAGHAGSSAAQAALEAGARVTVLTRSAASCDAARSRWPGTVEADIASAQAIERHALAADLVVGAVFVPAERTPKLLPRPLVARMKRGAMIVDISIDAGGVAETSRPTTHANPTYAEEGVIHYCVANMPAANPQESAAALSGAVLPFARELATKGIARAVRENPALRTGVLLWKGRVNQGGIAAEAGLAYTPLSDAELT